MLHGPGGSGTQLSWPHRIRSINNVFMEMAAPSREAVLRGQVETGSSLDSPLDFRSGVRHNLTSVAQFSHP